MMVEHIKAMLDSEWIPYLVKNQFLSGAIGELPPTECWPDIWIENDEQHDRAMSIVNAALHSQTQESPSWKCQCGELIEGQFSDCWNCGEPQPDH